METNKGKIIMVDFGCLMFSAIFAHKFTPQIPVTYTTTNMILANLLKVGVQSEDIIMIACDEGHSWRKDYDPCLDEQTEVLTKLGWKYLKDIVEKKEKVKIATLNPKTNKVEYQYPNNYYKRFYRGEMFKFGGRGCQIDLLMTPEHSHYTKNTTDEKFTLQLAKDIRRYKINHNKQFNYNKKGLKYIIIPKLTTKSITTRGRAEYTYIVKHPKRKIEINLWLKFLGWYLTEGSCGGRRYCGYIKPYSVVIPQSFTHNPANCKEIEDILKELNETFCITKRKNINSYSISNTQLANYLKNTFGNSFHKFIPRILLNKLNKKQCQLLLKTMIKGDGTVRIGKKTVSYAYTTVSKQLANDVQELALKAGYTATITMPNQDRTWYGVSILDKYITESYKNIIKNWQGDVYDIEIPNHIFYIRRNGKCCWTGNCYKADRKEKRESHTDINWKLTFEMMNDLLVKLDISTNWHIIQIESMEADDIQAVATRYYKDNEVVLITFDADMEQLLDNKNVKIFSPKSKKYKFNTNPLAMLAKKLNKEAVDGLTNPILNEEDFDRRNLIVNLRELPEFVETPIINKFKNLEVKTPDIDEFPFFSLKEKYLNLCNNKTKIVTIEKCEKEIERKKKRKKVKKS
jgi:AraC-like DNA-binding protein